jgi:thioredoxin-like negative regulator of GroEL
MVMKNIILIVLFAAQTIHASEISPENSPENSLRSGSALRVEVRDNDVVAELKEGFHFNDKAPNRVLVGEKVISSDRLIPREAKFKLPGGWGAAEGLFFVCDDAKTYCESHRVSMQGGFVPTTSETGKAKTQEKSPKAKGRTNRHGFIEDDLAKALQLANAGGKLVLIDFSARWCPGCVRLENEVFETKKFRNMTRNMVKVKLDMDRFENIVISEKFNVRAIPTLLVLNASQNEISRIVDYQPIARVERFFADIKNNPTPTSELLSEFTQGKMDMGPQRILLGRRLSVANQHADAVRVLEGLSPKPSEYWTSQVELALANYKSDKSKKTNYLNALREALKAEPASFRSINWRTQLVGELDDKSEMQALASEGVRLADELLKSPLKLKEVVRGDFVGEFSGYERLLVAMSKAELTEAAHLDGKAAWKQAAEVGRSIKISPKQAGPALRFLIVLMVAGEWDEADQLAKALLKRNPNDGDLQRRRLRVLVELKKYNDAVALGKLAIANSYERNEFWVAEFLAKALIGAAKKEDAKKLLDTYLSRADADWSNMKDTRGKLESLRKTL